MSFQWMFQNIVGDVMFFLSLISFLLNHTKFEKSLFVCLSTFFSETNQIAIKLGMNINTGLGRVLMEPQFWYHL